MFHSSGQKTWQPQETFDFPAQKSRMPKQLLQEKDKGKMLLQYPNMKGKRMRNDQETFFEAFVSTLQEASLDKKRDQVPPAALLWPDKDGQWEPLLPRLRTCLPIFTLGTYDPKGRIGPAYWLRCIVAGTLPEHVLPLGQVPMLYLPGLSTRELRAVAELPRLVQPLAELQYRGVLWRQKKSGRDWTVRAFFQNVLAIELCQDTETKVALLSALSDLADEPLAHLRQAAPLQATFFKSLLA